MKDSFIFYKEWRDAIADLPNDVRLEIYEAIIEYGISGKIPALKPIANIAFNFIKTKMDKDITKYNSVVERNRANGLKGGRPKTTQDNPIKPTGFCGIPNEPKKADNDNEYDNKDNTPNGVLKKDAAKAATLKRRDEFKKTLFPFVGKYDKEMIKAFFDYWSELNKSETKMRFEMQKTWEVGRRLATWANNENNYGNNRKTTTSKQEANEYAVQLLSDRLQQREQSVFGEIPKPF